MGSSMMPGVSLNLKGVRPEALETVREAARRSGMSVDDWLNSVIVDKAPETGGAPQRPDDARVELEQIPLSPTDEAAFKEESRDDQRKDRVEPALDPAARPSTARISPSPNIRPPHERPPFRATDVSARLEARLNQISEGRRTGGEIDRRIGGTVERPQESSSRERSPPTMPMPASPLERAVAEITARQRELDQTLVVRPHTPLPEMPLFAGDPQPSRPDLSGLQDQLAQLTSRIETMRRPCAVEDQVKALRGDLADIARTLTAAMPRQAIESLENEVRGLAQRLAESRRSGADVTALAGVERGLAE